jgi:hypothetical protein
MPNADVDSTRHRDAEKYDNRNRQEEILAPLLLPHSGREKTHDQK